MQADTSASNRRKEEGAVPPTNKFAGFPAPINFMRIRKIMVGAVIAVLAALMTALPVLAKETTDISHGSEQPVSCIADAVSSAQDAKTKKEKARSNDEAEAEQAFKAIQKTLLPGAGIAVALFVIAYAVHFIETREGPLEFSSRAMATMLPVLCLLFIAILAGVTLALLLW